MIRSSRQSRAPLLNALRKAFAIAKISKEPAAPPAEELVDQYIERKMHRRRFLGDIVKTGAVIGAAGFLDACRKLPDWVPDEPKDLLKIAIIGGGVAGLNCAYRLKKAGYRAAVYEGSSRIGGRIFTGKDILAPGLTTELGGEFIDSDHEDMIGLCQEFGLPLIDTLSESELGYARDSFFIDGRFYTEEEVIEAFLPYAARIDASINSLPDEMTYDNHDAATLALDSMSIKDYLDSIGMTGFIRKGIEVAYLTEYGLETDIQSSINFLFLFSPDTSEGFSIFGASDERYKVQGGNQGVPTALYQRVKNQVHLGYRLVKISQSVTGYWLYFSNPNGTVEKVYANVVVSAIPFTLLRKVELDLPLPGWKLNAINNLGYGTNAKLLMGFNKRVWRDYQYSGYMFSDREIQSGWDNSTLQPGRAGGFTVFQGGDKGVALGNGTPEQQAAKMLDQMETMWRGSKSAFNGNVKRMHWPTYPFTLASYACYTVGQYTTIRGAERKRVGQLFFAGEHCSADYQGFMNGAAESGRMAAEEILQLVRSFGNEQLIVDRAM